MAVQDILLIIQSDQCIVIIVISIIINKILLFCHYRPIWVQSKPTIIFILDFIGRTSNVLLLFTVEIFLHLIPPLDDPN